MDKQNNLTQNREEFLKEKVRKNFPPLLVKSQTIIGALMSAKENA